MSTSKRSGFTIIEVVLVLAIAGLIFLMVFIALPALQRGQRNTQRKNDLSRFATAASSYMANNSNKSPFVLNDKTNKVVTEEDKAKLRNFVTRYIDGDCQDGGGTLDDNPNWKKYVQTFTGCGSQFQDPDGENYKIEVRYTYAPDFEGKMNQSVVKASTVKDAPLYDHRVLVYARAKCAPEEGWVIFGQGSAQFAMFYELEGGAFTCVDNQ
ncbi:type II secretion system protein [Candidatus Saccharibacteria bacterium]|nr:type II secretion system protein [Candidatus Saccharibacteria bacterium]